MISDRKAMKLRVFAYALVVAVLISASAEGEDGRHTTCLEALSLRMTHPGHLNVDESGGTWHLAEYVISDTRPEPGYGTSIVLTAHTVNSIKRSVAQCEESNAAPEASGDVLCLPSLATYETRRQLLSQNGDPREATVRTVGGRRFVVEEVHGEGLHLRTYSTFFGDLMIEVTFNNGIPPGPDRQASDEFVSQLSFEDGACQTLDELT